MFILCENVRFWGPLQNPVGPQMGAPICQVALTMWNALKDGATFEVVERTSLRSCHKMLPRGRPKHPRLIFDDFGSLLAVFAMISRYALAPTFEPKIVKHSPHPPTKMMPTICQDLQAICQDPQTIARNKMRAYNTRHRNHRLLNTRPARHKGGR